MTDKKMTGEEILLHAAELGPEKGIEFLTKTFADGGDSKGFVEALGNYLDSDTGDVKDDFPKVKALAEAARVAVQAKTAAAATSDGDE